MSSGLDARDLRLIAAIAEAGSVAGAARLLNCSQPTASQHLAGLETRLGAELVERGPRGARLTEAGELLAEHADGVLEHLDIAESDVRRQVEHGVSTLRLGSFASAGPELASRAVARLRPFGLHVEVIEAEVPELLEGLRRRQVHAGLIFTSSEEPPPALAGVSYAHLLEDEHLVVLPAGHPAAARGEVTLEELREESWIAAPEDDDPSYATLVRACGRVGFEPTFSHRIDSLATTQGFVAAGLGISLLPRLAVEPAREDVVVRPLVGARVARSIHLAYLDSLAPALRERLLAALSTPAAGAPA